MLGNMEQEDAEEIEQLEREIAICRKLRRKLFKKKVQLEAEALIPGPVSFSEYEEYAIASHSHPNRTLQDVKAVKLNVCYDLLLFNGYRCLSAKQGKLLFALCFFLGHKFLLEFKVQIDHVEHEGYRVVRHSLPYGLNVERIVKTVPMKTYDDVEAFLKCLHVCGNALLNRSKQIEDFKNYCVKRNIFIDIFKPYQANYIQIRMESDELKCTTKNEIVKFTLKYELDTYLPKKVTYEKESFKDNDKLVLDSCASHFMAMNFKDAFKCIRDMKTELHRSKQSIEDTFQIDVNTSNKHSEQEKKNNPDKKASPSGKVSHVIEKLESTRQKQANLEEHFRKSVEISESTGGHFVSPKQRVTTSEVKGLKQPIVAEERAVKSKTAAPIQTATKAKSHNLRLLQQKQSLETPSKENDRLSNLETPQKILEQNAKASEAESVSHKPPVNLMRREPPKHLSSFQPTSSTPLPKCFADEYRPQVNDTEIDDISSIVASDGNSQGTSKVNHSVSSPNFHKPLLRTQVDLQRQIGKTAEGRLLETRSLRSVQFHQTHIQEFMKKRRDFQDQDDFMTATELPDKGVALGKHLISEHSLVAISSANKQVPIHWDVRVMLTDVLKEKGTDNYDIKAKQHNEVENDDEEQQDVEKEHDDEVDSEDEEKDDVESEDDESEEEKDDVESEDEDSEEEKERRKRPKIVALRTRRDTPVHNLRNIPPRSVVTEKYLKRRKIT